MLHALLAFVAGSEEGNILPTGKGKNSRHHQTGSRARTVAFRVSIEQQTVVGFGSKTPKTAQMERTKGSGASTETLPEKILFAALESGLVVSTRAERKAASPAVNERDYHHRLRMAG